VSEPLKDRYREFAAISDAWRDAELPRGHEEHAGWLLERAAERGSRTGRGSSRGYGLYELHFLANEGLLLANDEFRQTFAAGKPIPWDPK